MKKILKSRSRLYKVINKKQHLEGHCLTKFENLFREKRLKVRFLAFYYQYFVYTSIGTDRHEQGKEIEVSVWLQSTSKIDTAFIRIIKVRKAMERELIGTRSSVWDRL